MHGHRHVSLKHETGQTLRHKTREYLKVSEIETNIKNKMSGTYIKTYMNLRDTNIMSDNKG
jgi:hypothetical protein